MILMGDEVRRTQRGNNNAYCQDNETNWFDWTLVAKHADVHRFVTLLNARRVLRDEEHERQRIEPDSADPAGEQILAWRQARPAGLEPQSHSIAFSAELRKEGMPLLLDPERATGSRSSSSSRRRATAA